MGVWLNRAGSGGEYEQKFIEGNHIYVTLSGLDVDLSKLRDRDSLAAAIAERYGDTKLRTIINWVGEIWPFVHEMKKRDLVVLPLKKQPAICIGEIVGDYRFDPKGPARLFHSRRVKWLAEAVPRANFGKDLLFTMGAFRSICRVRRNNAECRIRAMRTNGWRAEPSTQGLEFSDTHDIGIHVRWK